MIHGKRLRGSTRPRLPIEVCCDPPNGFERVLPAVSDDLVRELRWHARDRSNPYTYLTARAADEIERLRVENDRRRSENDRLREELRTVAAYERGAALAKGEQREERTCYCDAVVLDSGHCSACGELVAGEQPHGETR